MSERNKHSRVATTSEDDAFRQVFAPPKNPKIKVHVQFVGEGHEYENIDFFKRHTPLLQELDYLVFGYELPPKELIRENGKEFFHVFYDEEKHEVVPPGPQHGHSYDPGMARARAPIMWQTLRAHGINVVPYNQCEDYYKGGFSSKEADIGMLLYFIRNQNNPGDIHNKKLKEAYGFTEEQVKELVSGTHPDAAKYILEFEKQNYAFDRQSADFLIKEAMHIAKKRAPGPDLPRFNLALCSGDAHLEGTEDNMNEYVKQALLKQGYAPDQISVTYMYLQPVKAHGRAPDNSTGLFDFSKESPSRIPFPVVASNKGSQIRFPVKDDFKNDFNNGERSTILFAYNPEASSPWNQKRTDLIDKDNKKVLDKFDIAGILPEQAIVPWLALKTGFKDYIECAYGTKPRQHFTDDRRVIIQIPSMKQEEISEIAQWLNKTFPKSAAKSYGVKFPGNDHEYFYLELDKGVINKEILPIIAVDVTKNKTLRSEIEKHQYETIDISEEAIKGYKDVFKQRKEAIQREKNNKTSSHEHGSAEHLQQLAQQMLSQISGAFKPFNINANLPQPENAGKGI